MKYKYRKHFAFFLFILFGIATFFLLLSSNPQRRLDIPKTMGHLDKPSKHNSKNGKQTLSVKIIENLKFKLPSGYYKLRIWIPLPATGEYQTVDFLKIESPLAYSVLKDPDFNNQILFFEMNSSPEQSSLFPSGQAPLDNEYLEIEWEYQIEREEQRGFSMNANYLFSNDLYLKERGLVIIDNRIRDIVKKVTSNISDPLEKAKALYDYVLTHVDYDTSVPGWGRGDVADITIKRINNLMLFLKLFIFSTKSL
ncbi:MAG: hypothetical protein IIC76_13295 [Bacteroidetes bacterium]|nr:hypothetical protein [Bacteroidota bacterium]